MNEQSEMEKRETEKMEIEAGHNKEHEKEEETKLQDDTVNMSEKAGCKDKVADSSQDEKKLSEEAPEIQNEEEQKSAELSLEEKYASLNDSHLRLIAEFDNFRKRTLREKADLIKSGGETVLTNLLPVIDDFERALDTLQETDGNSSATEGVRLIYDKFIGYLSQQGVKKMDALEQPFDTEFFEAIATIPAPEAEKKGKIIDCVQNGYMLYDKVIRHAKVVVGE